MGTLREEFEYVCNVFFPRWYSRKEWKICRQSKQVLVEGLCSHIPKTIQVNSRAKGDFTELHAVLIHEIIHAVTPGHHNKKWLIRMEKVAQKADSLRMLTLAADLRAQIERYSDGRDDEHVPISEYYNRIEILTWKNPTATFDEVAKSFCVLHTISRADFRKYFRRAKKVHLKAQKDISRFGTQEAMRAAKPAKRLKSTDSMTYEEIEGALQDRPELSFEALIDRISSSYDMTREDFLRAYPKSRRHYDYAQKDQKRMEAMREKHEC